MATEIQIHKIQAEILKVLLFTTEAKFSELNTSRMASDHFTFHIHQLIEFGLLEKNMRGRYALTAQGKEFANRFDTEKVTIEKQPKLAVLVVAVKKRGKQTIYLTQTRLKHPFYGFRGFVTGKMRWGEKLLETAARELKEETGLIGKLTFMSIEHKMDYDKESGHMLEDKLFTIIKATQVKGMLIENFEGGRNSWMTEREILADKKLFDDMPKILKVLKSDNFHFFEDAYRYSSQQY